MKTTTKITYNHKLAQSQESWEANFLSKIDDANKLLFLAAIKSNNYDEIDDKYYTKENKQKILSTLDEIISSPYNQRFHKVFETFLAEAKAKLDSKIAGNNTAPSGDTSTPSTAKTPAQSPSTSSPGKLTVETDGKFKSTVQSYDGDEIRKLLDQAKTIAKNKPESLKIEWIPILDKIKEHWPYIEPSEVTEFNQDLESLHIKYNEQFYPQGGKMVNGKFFPYTIEELIETVEDSIFQKNTGKANDAVGRIKIIYSKNRRFQPDIDKLNKLNAKIREYNRKNTDNQIGIIQ
jgi:hypothetical protein